MALELGRLLLNHVCCKCCPCHDDEAISDAPAGQRARADADAVAAYLRALSGVEQDPRNPLKRRAPATIERYLVNIGWAYRMAGLEDPTAAPLVGASRSSVGCSAVTVVSTQSE